MVGLNVIFFYVVRRTSDLDEDKQNVLKGGGCCKQVFIKENEVVKNRVY